MKSLHKFISNLDNSLQNELWDESIGEKKISKMKGDYCRSRFIIYSENYLDFLTEVAFAENLTWLKHYIDRRRVMGSISPSGYRTIF